MNLTRAIIGVGVGALSLLGWKLINNFKLKAKLPTKEETLLILENVRIEFYPVLVKIADLVVKQLVPRGVAPEDNEKWVMADPEIKEQIEAINLKIYAKYSEEEFKEAAENVYKDDGDILKHRQAFREEYKKSLLGVKPDQQMVASRKLSKAKVLITIKAILESKLDRLRMNQIKEKDENDRRAILEADIEEDERVTKQKLLENMGLYPKDCIDIFHVAVATYKREDESFAAEYNNIIQSYNQNAKAILSE